MTLENLANNNICAEMRHSYKMAGRHFRLVRAWVVLLTATLAIFTPGGLVQAQDQTALPEPANAIELPGSDISNGEFALRLVHLTKPELEETAKGL
jgi:hypothetical protein